MKSGDYSHLNQEDKSINQNTKEILKTLIP